VRRQVGSVCCRQRNLPPLEGELNLKSLDIAASIWSSRFRDDPTAVISSMVTIRPPKTRPALCRAIKTAIFILALGSSVIRVSHVAGEEREQRLYDQITGFATPSIFSIDQDEEGFLWVGLEGGGLARFDGREFKRWAPDKITTHVLFARGTGERVVLITEFPTRSESGNTLYQISGDDVEPIPGPGGQLWTGVRDATYDQVDRLWVARRKELYFRSGESDWTEVSSSFLSGNQIRRLAANRSGGVFVVTTAGIFSIDGTGAVSSLVRSAFAADVIDRGDGSVFYAEMRPEGGWVFELRNGRSTGVTFLRARFNHFIQRGRTVWVGFDVGVVALRPGEPPEFLGPAEGVPGGANLVDREGSLWVGTARGLVQIPEPETVLWDQRDDLPIPSTRYLARTDEGVWLATWGGLCRLRRVEGKWRVSTEKAEHKWPLIEDAQGNLWGKERDTFFKRERGRYKTYRVAGSGVPQGVARASDGTVWIGTDRGLFKTTLDGSAPQRMGCPSGVNAVDQVLEDSRGELWLTSSNKICHARADAVASRRRADWQCEELAETTGFSKLIQTPSGALWLASRSVTGGVWRYEPGGSSQLAASRALPAQPVANMVRSRFEGVWLLGPGFVVRVVESADSVEGWEVVEELNQWEGLPPSGMRDLIEEPDGTLWIATNAGLIRMRPDARRARPQAPRIKPTAVIVNGKQIRAEPIPSLPYLRNHIELHFAALAFRSPALLRYQYRLRKGDEWTDSKSYEPVFRFFDLSPGHYTAEVRASLDGVEWSATPASVDFEVLRPWYQTWWAIGSFVLFIALALFVIHEARVAVLVRLERQRALIAMDLHDDIGSGLGSIGILSGVAASENVGDEHRRQLARSIADTAAEMGSALTDIVWSLHPDSASLEGLAYRLAQRAYRLFPENYPTFKTNFPREWPRVDLSLAARHNLLLIASEALHNAARHANANEVELGIAQAGRSWKLWISDDGCGLGGGNCQSTDKSGLGLITMRKRAEEIGARIAWSSADGRGTTVTVLFSPDAKRQPLE
jgi:signal transduction histidine kinase